MERLQIVHLTKKRMRCGIMLGHSEGYACGSAGLRAMLWDVSLRDLHADCCELCDAVLCSPCLSRHMNEPQSKPSVPSVTQKLKRLA